MTIHKVLTTSVGLARRKVPASPVEKDMQFFKCCGHRPSGHAPEPCRKEKITACILVWLKHIGGVEALWDGGSLRSAGA